MSDKQKRQVERNAQISRGERSLTSAFSAIRQEGLLRNRVYEYLKHQMSVGALAPGSSINMNELIRDLGVSRTPLREALLKLQMEGFVTILPQRGIIINKLTLKDVLDIYEILGALESRVLLSVFDDLQEDDILMMGAINELMKDAQRRQNFKKFVDRNNEFHETFLRLSDNGALLRTINLLKGRLYYFPRVIAGKGWSDENIREHEQLLALIKNGQKKEAVDYLRDVHWVFRYSDDFLAATGEEG